MKKFLRLVKNLFEFLCALVFAILLVLLTIPVIIISILLLPVLVILFLVAAFCIND